MRFLALALILFVVTSCSRRKAETTAGSASPPASTAGAPATTAPPLTTAEIQKFYGFKSAQVEYSVKTPGNTQSLLTAYIDDYGARFATDARVEIIRDGRPVSTRSGLVMTPQGIYMLDFTRQQAIRWPPLSRPEDLQAPFATAVGRLPKEKQARAQSMLQIAYQALQQIADFRRDWQTWKPVSEETFLGRQCGVYDATAASGVKPLPPADQHVYIIAWKNLTLKTRTARGEVLMDARSLKVDIPIPADRFAPPAGFRVIDWTEFIAQ